jgi:chromosome segregation protein
MKLESLALQGFKSFGDRTLLEFRDGLTAIVGSNGCGKSNIADGIRWVLGEQRASALRGARMDDVIFQGTSRRRPLQMAEVSLLFSNEDGAVAIPQTQIEVGRKVFREGGSDYVLNGHACRLRDIHDLLRDTGLGAHAYAIIEASMIETILSERADERRQMLEEAAGIGKYKDRRRTAIRRLESAETDLERLGDLIDEVGSKVRSLARQRGKAQRHRDMRARRLDLEVALTRAELAEIRRALAADEERSVALVAAIESGRASAATLETRMEERKLGLAQLARERVEVAQRLETVRGEIERRERERLVADERRAAAESRIEQLAREAESLRERQARAAAEGGEVSRAAAEGQEALDLRRGRLDARREENAAFRDAVVARRGEVAELEARARSLTTDIARAEATRHAAEDRLRRAGERRVELDAEIAEVEEEIARLGGQTELFTSRADEVRSAREAAAERARLAREHLAELTAAEAGARRELDAAEDRLSRTAAQVAAREAVERGYEGFTPAVAAIMAERDRFPGVQGALADFVPESGGHDGSRTEAFLGPLLQAVVVEDLDAARRVRIWFQKEWSGGGALTLLPLDAPRAAAEGGTGAAWVRVLLADLDPGAGDPLDDHVEGLAAVDEGGVLRDARGVIRLGAPVRGEGILARRAALDRLRREQAEIGSEVEAARSRREAARLAVEQAEREAAVADEALRAAGEALRAAEVDAEAHEHRAGRLAADRDRLLTALEELQRRSVEAEAEVNSTAEARVRLEGESATAEASLDEARGSLREMEERWERLRDEEAELRIEVTRLEGEVREAARRAEDLARTSEGAARRLAQVEAEAEEQRSRAAERQAAAPGEAEALEALFESRQKEQAELGRIDAEVSALERAVAVGESELKAARRTEAEASEERHQVEIRMVERRGRLEHLQETLEAEWGRPWASLVEEASEVEEGTPSEWRAEIAEIARKLDALGPINMLAVEEHQEEEERLAFLNAQLDDLTAARDDLSSAVREINRTAREIFRETFDAVRENFRRTFDSLFPGGQCDLWLEDPDDPLESNVEIHAAPRGKRTQRLHQLSGGERTLTALALLFGIYLTKPSPFCVLDEVDAPLDEANVGRFIQLLERFKGETQFIVITHNPRTMEAADWLYGVTMEEPGVSSVVGVELEEAREMSQQVA